MTAPVAGGPDAGTYAVLRAGLARHGRDLARAAGRLDAERAAVFASTTPRVLGIERVHTPAPAVAGDLVWAGGLLVVGFAGTPDVFAAYAVDDSFRLTPADAPWLRDGQLRADLAELYRYHRHTRLLRLRRTATAGLSPKEATGNRVLAEFQVGPRTTDVRVLRWAIDADGSVSYVDNQGEHDAPPAPPADVVWTPVDRTDHVTVDRRPALLVDGAVHVSTTGGALTVAPAHDPETVYTEPVDEPLQSLADAEVAYARVGALVLLRIRPYREDADRYLVHNTHTRTVVRLDGIGRACRRLPDDRGVVFPGGYCLGSGVTRTFGVDDDGMEFDHAVRPPDGADVLYVFRSRATGRSLLLPYDVVRDEVGAPIDCHGHALTGEGILFVLPRPAGGTEPGRVHPVQAWDTPYVDEPAGPTGDGPLARIGNADLVRAVADCLTLARSASEVPDSAAAIGAIVTAGDRLLDRHHWLGDLDLRAPLTAVRDAATRLLDEYGRARVAVAAARARENEADERVTALVRRAEAERPDSTAGWVGQLAGLRAVHGLLATVRGEPHVRPQRMDDLAARLDAAIAGAGRRAVTFLAGGDAFAPYGERLDDLDAAARDVASGADADALAARLAGEIDGLRAVTDIVGGLADTDTAQRALILERVGAVLARLNHARATLDVRARTVRTGENRAAFAAESALLQQSLTAALALADTPRRCDAELAALLVRLESLAARFDDDDQAAALAATGDAVRDAFAARRQNLLDERTRRVDRVTASCERVFAAVAHRAAELSSVDDVDAYFAGDPLVGRLRALADELRDLDEPVRAADVAARLVAARQDAARTVRDRADLYDDGGATLRLGAHRFAVTTEPVEVALLPHGDDLAVTVTGTGYRRPVRDPQFAATRRFWDRPVGSESPRVYRAEYLAADLLDPALRGDAAPAALVAEAVAARPGEGYVTGVHDHDATAILTALLDAHAAAGLLRYPPDARAAAQMYWALAAPGPDLAARAAALVRARDTVGAVDGARALAGDLRDTVHRFLGAAGLPTGGDLVGEYLVEELATEPAGFVTDPAARELLRRFEAEHGPVPADPDPAARHLIASAWLAGFATDPAVESVAMAVCDVPRYDGAALAVSTVDGMRGAHPRIVDGRLEFRLDDLLARTRDHATHELPAYREYRAARARLVTRERERLRIDEHRPAVPDSFVRNRLIDEVYLPLLGDNFARQLGTADAGDTERSGLLVLVSPPGYGKTTLVEYVTSRLGLLLVTVDGPSLGTGTTSLDPDRAPDAAARREVEKINLALELGTNVMLYVDDIQHTSPELLQRFVPLCDAGRSVESVRDGRAVTVDLRGARFAVCLAGNPYTSSGQEFRLPDMLASRADVVDLGEVLSGRDDLFELSYLENARADDSLTPHLERVRAVLLAVNRAYIASAAQADASRTEPPFLLQGSYRDMNAIARRVHPAMDPAEVDSLVDDHYAGEARTLGPHAEANLLKLAELRGGHSAEQAERWAHVTEAYRRRHLLGGSDDDPVARAVGAITVLTDRLEAAILRSAAPPGRRDGSAVRAGNGSFRADGGAGYGLMRQ